MLEIFYFLACGFIFFFIPETDSSRWVGEWESVDSVDSTHSSSISIQLQAQFVRIESFEKRKNIADHEDDRAFQLSVLVLQQADDAGCFRGD